MCNPGCAQQTARENCYILYCKIAFGAIKIVHETQLNRKFSRLRRATLPTITLCTTYNFKTTVPPVPGVRGWGHPSPGCVIPGVPEGQRKLWGVPCQRRGIPGYSQVRSQMMSFVNVPTSKSSQKPENVICERTSPNGVYVCWDTDFFKIACASFVNVPDCTLISNSGNILNMVLLVSGDR